MKEIRRFILVIVAGLGLAATVANAEFVGFGSVTNGAEDNAVLFDSRSFPGDIFFSGNRLPAGENDAVSTSAQIPIPA